MDQLKFQQFIVDHEDRLKRLKKKEVLIIGSLSAGGLLDDIKHAEKNAKLFNENQTNAFKALLTSQFLNDYAYPVLIDFEKAIDLYENSDQEEMQKIETAILMSRVNFMGTDGIRGKVVLETKENFIDDLLADNVFSPDLVETTSFSFAKILSENGMLKAGDTVVIGNDGRDLAYDWKINQAVIDGFNRASLDVLDMGIVPTAIVPYKMLQKGYHGAAMITASHNPSNQNGIKFFIDGKKLLPEGACGDYVLSAYMYKYCLLESLPPQNGSLTNAKNVVEESATFVLDVLPDNISEILKDTTLVLDAANGSFADISEKVLNTLGIDWTTVNEAPTGANINRSCGVAEIEGTERFEGSGYDGHITSVKKIFDKGRVADAGKVFGIALDGDGDRGFLLYYDKPQDCIHVIDGDKCGYILSDYFIKTKNLNPKDYWFISTIESDIMTATSAEEILGLNKKIVSVGDKWICNFTEGNVLVGLEISGHLIFPISIKTDVNTQVSMLSGVGLLTGLMSLVAIKGLDLSPQKIVEPFEPGVSKTKYVFFVDKTKFYRNSIVWAKDSDLIKETVERLKTEGVLSNDTKLVFEDKEDPNVLYINIVNDNGLLGCIFMRNSGTEDKTAVYVKGKNSIKEALYGLSQIVQNNHLSLLKNENRIEYKYEAFILKVLNKKTEISFAEIKQSLESDTGTSINESDLFSVVYGLKKEGRVVLENNVLKLV